MRAEKAKLNKCDAMILEVKSRHLRSSDAAKELGLSAKTFENAHRRIVLELVSQGAGKRIKGSRLSRAFCPRCLEPLRSDGGAVLIMCQDCDPPHRGVGYAPGGEIEGRLNDTEHDPDAYSPSWKQQ